MRKAATLIVLVCLICLAGQAWAQTEDTITVTVSLQSEICVTLDSNSWNIGGLASLPSTVGPRSASATVCNTTTDLEIKATDGASGWSLAPLQGKDAFRVVVSSPAINLSTLYQSLATAGPYGEFAFNLTYFSPTEDSIGAGADQSFGITVKASAP